MTQSPLALRQLLEKLVAAEVGFVLVGGLAVNAWGYLRATRDIDLVPAPDAGNLDTLAAVLEGLDGVVETAEGRLASTAIRTFLRAGDRTLVSTNLGAVDVLQGHPQVPTHAELLPGAQTVDVDGLEVSVCSLEALLAMKDASSRPRDADDAAALREARAQVDERP